MVNGKTVKNRFANCENQGNIAIIQEDSKKVPGYSDRYCPDDSSTGGWLKFQFKDPYTTVELSSLLDIDDNKEPMIRVQFHNGVQWVWKEYETEATGDDGLYFQPILMDRVKKFQVRYYGSGSLASIKYSLCPSGQSVNLPAASEYLGCWRDANDRAMSQNPSNSIQGVQACRQRCRDDGYKYAGLQYKKQCFCGNSYTKHHQLDESECDTECDNTPGEICGGSWALSVYAANDF